MSQADQFQTSSGLKLTSSDGSQEFIGMGKIRVKGGKKTAQRKGESKESSSFKVSPVRGYIVVLQCLTVLTWTARETPNRLEETQASRLTSVQLLFSGFTWYTQRSSTTCRRHNLAVNTDQHLGTHQTAFLPAGTYHKTCVVDVPGECGHGSILGVHNRVLQDVDGVGDVGWEEALCPAGHPVGLGQEPPGQQLVVRRHLPMNDVFGQDMFATMERRKKLSGPATGRQPPCGWEPSGTAGKEDWSVKGEDEPASRREPLM